MALTDSIPWSAKPHGRGTWYRALALYRLYEIVRQRTGGPPLQLFRTLPDDAFVPTGIEPLVGCLFERALRRLRTGLGAGVPSVAVRVELEGIVDGGEEVVVRVFDNGPISDPPGLPVPEIDGHEGVCWRREPPAGSWTGIGVLRIGACHHG